MRGQRWVVVADSPFLPANGGGEAEHVGFVRCCVEAGVLAALVVPTDADPSRYGRADDLQAIREMIAPAALILTPRRRTALSVVQGRTPYPVASRPVPRSLVRDVRAAAPDANGVVGFSYRSHRVAGALARGLGVPAVMRMHNLEGRYFHSLAGAKPRWAAWAVHLEATRIDLDERLLERASWVNGLADISRTDALERQRRTRTRVAHVPTFVVARAGVQPDVRWQPGAEQEVLFLGALDVPTNHEALDWLCERVWPAVRQRVPSAVLTIAGRRPTEGVRRLVEQTPGARLLPDIADPRAMMARCSVAVNPAVTGSGVNIKLVEYLDVGAPVVSTALGAQALSLRDGSELLIRDDPEAFAEAICELLTNRERAAAIGAAGGRAAAALREGATGLDLIAQLLGHGQDRHGRTPGGAA